MTSGRTNRVGERERKPLGRFDQPYATTTLHRGQEPGGEHGRNGVATHISSP